MRRFIRSLTPPFLGILYAKTLNSLHSGLGSKEGYKNEKLIDLVIQKNIALRNQIVVNQVDNQFFRLAAAVGLARTNKVDMRVLDFGGGAGHHQLIAALAYPDIAFDWTVVETPGLTDSAKQMISVEGLKFISDLNALKDEIGFDLVHSNSAIQYTSDPLATLEALASLRSTLFYFTRIPMSTSGKCINYNQVSKLSANGPGTPPVDFVDSRITYPVTIPSRIDVEKLLQTNNLIWFVVDEGPWEQSRFGDKVRTFSVIARPTV